MTEKQKGNLLPKNLNKFLSEYSEKFFKVSDSTALLKDSVEYLKRKENLIKLLEGIFFCAVLIFFIFIHVCWLKSSNNWGSSVMVGILQIIALVAVFPMVRNHVFKEITSTLRGQAASKSQNSSNDEEKETEGDGKKSIGDDKKNG